MKIACIGAGGVGGYFGGRLASAGEEVTFLARGGHLEAMRREGLTLEGPAGSDRIHPVRATGDPASVGPVDLVVVAVKHWDLAGAVPVVRRLLGPATEVLTLLNGVEAPDILAREFGPERVIGGVAFIVAAIDGPGRIRYGGFPARLSVGGLGGRHSETATEFSAACSRAGFEARIAENIESALWEKFVFLSAMSGITSAARLPIGPLRQHPGTRDLIQSAMREATELALARGVTIPPDTVARQMAICDRLPADSVSSMLTDLSRGNRLELPWLSGAVARMGRESGVRTPTHAFFAALLGPLAEGAG